MSCLNGFAKFYVFFINTIILLITVIAYAALIIELQRGVKIEGVAIGLGVVIACSILAVTGLCGAMMEVRALLAMNACGMSAIVSLQVYSIITYHRREAEITKFVENIVTGFIQHDVKIIHFLESLLECCGTTGPDYYQGAYSPTCCQFNTACNTTNVYKTGCATILTNIAMGMPTTAWEVLIGITVFEALTVIAALYIFYVVTQRAYNRKENMANKQY